MKDSIDIALRLTRPRFSLDVALKLPMHGVTGVYGASGAGKTTLLRCIAGLESEARGRLSIGEALWQDSERGVVRPTHARRLGYVFQEPRLFSHLDVRRNLDYGRQRAAKDDGGVSYDKVLDLLGLRQLIHRMPDTLSGGEAQRVAIGRALLRNPRIMLMDEPLSGIDRRRKQDLLPFLDRLQAELSLPIVYVSHDMDELCCLCDRLVVLSAGRVVADGDLQSVLAGLAPPAVPDTEVSTMLMTEIVDYDATDDLTRLRFSGGEFFVAGCVGTARKALKLRIKANDVSLCREKPTLTSILNVLPTQIEGLEDIGSEHGASTVLVHLRAGTDRLSARVTRRSCRAMQLCVGEKVYAQVKSASIRNVAAAIADEA